MHKSGTTLVSRILHESGVKMGTFDSGITYDKGNKFERAETLAANKTLLNAWGVFSVDVFHPLYPEDLANKDKNTIENAIDFIQEGDQGFKDPRTCLTYFAWLPYLPENHRIIAVYRDPVELWLRYKRDFLSGRSFFSGIIKGYRLIPLCWKVLRAWAFYNANIYDILATRQPEQVIVFEYSMFMNGCEEFNRLQKFMGRQLTDARDPGMFRSRQRKSFLCSLMRCLLGFLYPAENSKAYSLLKYVRLSKHSQG